MGQFEENLTSQKNWIHDLAQTELHPDAESVLKLGRSFDPHQLVEEETHRFLTELKEQFNEFTRVFNAYSQNGSSFQEIKVYSVAQTPLDFMLFRNQIKLIFSNSTHGVIQIKFAQHARGMMSVNGLEQSNPSSFTVNPIVRTSGSHIENQSYELLASLGPFRNVFWTFQNEMVNAYQVAKFYFAEFSKLTRDTKRSLGGNQLLLNQIKALLHEKGLDF